MLTQPMTAFVGLVGGRLSLSSGVPVTTADVTAAATVYFTPLATQNQVTVWDGTALVTVTLTEQALAVPASVSTPYDVFAFKNGNAINVEALAWASDSARATAVTVQNGFLAKSGDATRRLVASFRTTAVNGQTEDSFVKRYVSNVYNRVSRILRRLETTGSWNYTTAVMRQANGSVLNQVDMLIGIADVELQLALQAVSVNTNADVARSASIGEDSTTTAMATQYGVGAGAIGGTIPLATERIHSSRIHHYPALGRHFYSWNEISAAVGTTTFGGTVGLVNPNSVQSGLIGSIQG